MKRPLFTVLLMAAMVTVSAQAHAGRGTITVAAVGDIMMGTNYPENNLPSEQGRSLFKNITPYLAQTDIRFGNLEGPLFDGELGMDGKTGGANRYLFRTPTEFGARLQEAGFNVMSLANNHARDFGRAGLDSTKQTLSRLGIQYSSKEGEVARFNVNGSNVALIATDYYSGNRSITNSKRTIEEIRGLKANRNLVIVSAHSGGEGGGAERVVRGPEFFLGENRGDVIGFAHDAIDAGADLILMHGPHVPRGMEIYKGRLIVYSLGNFVTERGISVAGNNGLAPLVRVEMDATGRFVSGHLVSFQQIRGRGVVVDPSVQALRLVAQVSASDFPETSPVFGADGSIGPRSDLRGTLLR